MARRLTIALAAAALAACGDPTRTEDRISPQELAAMVAPQLDIARAGDLARARSEFEALLARSDAEQAPDLLTAFGVGLYTLGSEGDEAQEERLKRAGVPYLEQAVPAMEKRFGFNHPEVALALNTWGDALRSLAPADPPRQADRAYARAYAIREKALGRDNAETLVALYRVAWIQGLPSRTGGDPTRIARSAALFRTVIRGRESGPDRTDRETPENARLALVEMYVANGRMEEAVQVARTTAVVGERRDWRCDIGPARAAVAAVLEERGRKAEADAVLHPPPNPPPACLFDPLFLRRGK